MISTLIINTFKKPNKTKKKCKYDMGKKNTPNDQRSISKNPNNPTYWTSVSNRANQLNSNNPEYKTGSGKSEEV